jgi:pimeloyl-ACP methyl ester carboxylesterase
VSLRKAADRSAGGIVGAAGAVAAGVAAGVLAEHRLVRRRVRPHSPGEGLPTLDGTREERVFCTSPHGADVALAVYEAGPADAVLTVVFVHGYTVTSECWAAQVRDLQGPGGPEVRLVLYDQRGHGGSGAGPTQDDTIEQLGRDLAEVLSQRVPEGPIVLVGHSMGGMTIMALAEQRPELFGDTIVAVALVGTSSGGMAQVSLGLPAAMAAPMGRLLPYAPRAAPIHRRAERLRASDSDLARLINAQVAFGPHAPAGAHAAMARMQAPMKLETMAAFLPTFVSHDRTGALGPLKAIPTVIVVGEHDVLTPSSHSRTIADALPDADLVEVPGSGHMVMMEAPDEVTDQLRRLISRVS